MKRKLRKEQLYLVGVVFNAAAFAYVDQERDSVEGEIVLLLLLLVL